MSWEDRIQTAAYTSPGGNRFEFLWENVSMSSTKKTTEFTFPDKDGAYIQDNGIGGRRFPFTLMFSGEDYDIEASSFLSALEEKGAGKLEHPVYGDRVVVPTGEITRRDDLTTAANQAVFQVIFSETIEDVTFPVSSVSESDAVTTAADDFQTATADQFEEQVQVDNTSEAANLQVTAEGTTSITEAYKDLTERDSEINAAFETLQEVYEEQVKNVVLEAADTALQLILLTRTPSRIQTAIQNEIDIYKNTIDDLTAAANQDDGTNNPKNDYLYNNIVVTSALVALCEAPLYADITTRTDAINTSEAILDLFDTIKAWQDENIVNLGIFDIPDSFCNLNNVVSKSVGYLTNIAFDLPSERREVLTSERQVIEYLASVGLSVNQYDDFVQWNDLTGDEIELLPMGFEALYYL